MKINRLFVGDTTNPYENIDFEKRTSVIRNPDGSIVFEMIDIMVPKKWSQVATDIIAQKYFRKAGVPQVDAQGQPVVDSTQNVLINENPLSGVEIL